MALLTGNKEVAAPTDGPEGCSYRQWLVGIIASAMIQSKHAALSDSCPRQSLALHAIQMADTIIKMEKQGN